MIRTAVLQCWHAGQGMCTCREVAAGGRYPGRCGDGAHPVDLDTLLSSQGTNAAFVVTPCGAFLRALTCAPSFQSQPGIWCAPVECIWCAPVSSWFAEASGG